MLGVTRVDYILETLTVTFAGRVTLVQGSSDPFPGGSGHQSGFQFEEVVAAETVGSSAAAMLVNLLDLGLAPQAMAPKQELIVRQGDSRGLQSRVVEEVIGAMPFELGRHQHWVAASYLAGIARPAVGLDVAAGEPEVAVVAVAFHRE